VRRSAVRRFFAATAAAASALVLAACSTAAGGSPAPSGSPGLSGGASSPAGSVAAAPTETFTFGTAAAPVGLDPALRSDTESFRITRQLMEGLVGVDPNINTPAPQLATSWEETNFGRSYVFTLRENVRFHDGEPFNAAAVCANFDRWFNFPAELRGSSEELAFTSVFGAFADTPEKSAYKGCEPLAEHQVQINLTTRMTGFIPALSQPAFAISSPKALAEQAADQLTRTRNGVQLSAYAEHPVGTGPFRFGSWEGDVVTLTSNPDYWGDRGEIQTVVFRTIPHPDSRRRALESGDIDGYDLVTVSNVTDLARNGRQILHRDPYSVLYLGMNASFPGLDNLKFRQAISHAIDKNAVLDGLFLDGTKTANQFIPPKLGVTSEQIENSGYNPALAKELLAEAGYSGEPLPFYYPRNVTRAYLPTPEKVYAELSRQLTAAGLNIKPVPIEWSDGYLARIRSAGDRAFHLGGWSGSYQDPDHFISPLFGAPSAEFGFNDILLFTRISNARSLPEGPERVQAYQEISTEVSELVPAVPLAFPVSAVALGSRVESYPASPVLDEVFSKVRLR
jgi:peptide/nickel transport system substrate-binding protein